MKRLNRNIKILFFILIILILTLGLGTLFSHTKRRYYPEYEKIDITDLIYKDELDSSDYDILYKQTGLSKIGIDRLKESESYDLILNIQNDYFSDYAIKHNYGGLFLCSDEYDNSINHVTLEDGDILISNSTHFSFFNIGHAALVTDAINNNVLEIHGYFSKSQIESASSFFYRDNFMVLRVNTDDEAISKVTEFAKTNLKDIDYGILRGIANKKNPPKLTTTQCAHIIWYSYMQYGIDLDKNGGGLVLVKDLINLDLVQIVQIYGFDSNNLWD